MRIVLFSLLVLGVSLIGAGCGGSSSGQDETSIVASFYPLAFAARQIAGPDTEVVNLTAAGVEPHDLELTARQAKEIEDADVVLYLGEGFQPAVEAAVAGREGTSVDLLAGQDLLEGAEGGHGAEENAADEEHGLDPHLWLDPSRYATMVEVIGDAVGRPGEASALAGRLRDLDAEIEAGLADCDRRAFVTSHAAFGYLAKRYGLEQIALSGLSPEAEPSPRALESLVEVVRATGATTVFFETLLPDDLARTVARESGATTATLDPLEGLTEEAASSGADYFSVMEDNLAALRTALGCR